jgi:hypothetical protein
LRQFLGQKRYAKNPHHQTLPEMKAFQALGDV